ncbi:MAG: class I SAM-dependent methyltransferase [Myxococcota bacterium]|nr:class I SAM-dependent methyltransferase [Myxococcota bacterium]
MPSQDLLFDGIERFHADARWGRVLDAGTGDHSLGWLRTLPTESLTLVTGAPARAERLSASLRPQDRALAGNWEDPTLLHGERFDVVLADYLLGAVEGFAPYFQDRLLGRLRRHVGGRLYFVGMEPLPDAAPDAGGQAILEMARLRDACILLAQHRCYREYPQQWVVRKLQESGYRVLDSWELPIVYRASKINRQLDVAQSKLRFFRDPELAQAMAAHIAELRERACILAETSGGIRLGSDYVIAAELQPGVRP